MFETRFSEQQINAIIDMEKKGNIALNIFFWLWRIAGIVGIIACINNFINPPTPPTNDYEEFLNLLILIIGIPMISGFFLGIPWLISHSVKKRVKKLKNGDFKVYIGIVADKSKHRHDNKTRYYIYIHGLNNSIKTNSMNYDTINIGQEVYVLQVGYEMSCYSYPYLNHFINYTM